MAPNLTESSREIRLLVNQSQPSVWALESGQPFSLNSGQIVPLLFQPRNASGVFSLPQKTTVDLVLQVCNRCHVFGKSPSHCWSYSLSQIAADSLDNMAHPIHLHGHYFRVLGSMANSTFPTHMTVAEVASQMSESLIGMALKLTNLAPMRDSAHLPEGGWLVLRFVADNPGVWLLHCHITSHLSVSSARSAVDLAAFP